MRGDSLRIGVVGVGSMGQNHLRVYRELDEEVVGFADTDEARRKKVGRRFQVPYFEDHRALLREEVDAVSVASPTSTHFQIVKDFLEAGVHVLVEKPMCLTHEEGQQLVALARREELVLAVGHIERYNPVVTYVKEALAENRFGNPITISGRRVSSFPPRVGDVGVIMDLAVHEVDVQRYLIGSAVETVYAHSGSHGEATLEDHANILLRFRNGVTGFVEVNWLTPMKVRRLALTCERSYVEVDYSRQSVTISSARLGPFDVARLYEAALEYDIREIQLQRQEPLQRELADFLGAIRKDRDPLVSGEDGVEVLRILTAAQRSCRQGKPVRLPN